jgi:signal transduction histidine kinase
MSCQARARVIRDPSLRPNAMRVLPTANKLTAPVASIRKRYWHLFYAVLPGLAGPLAIAVTPDSQHVFWSAMVFLAAAVSCAGPGQDNVPYGPMIAVPPLAITAAIAKSSATPSLLALAAAAIASCWAIRALHRREAKQAQATTVQPQHNTETGERHAMQLLAAASHDLRQPVQALVAQVDLLEGDTGYISARQFVELQTSVNTLAEMLDDLLDVSRVNMGLYEPKLQPVNIRLLLKEVEQVFAINANAKGLRLLIECPDEVWVNSDLKLLRRIVFNLVANAIRYTDVGGIRLACLLSQGRALLQVEDTGKGMNVANLAVKSTGFALRPTTSYQGLGLGLGIVSTMALRLGHKLRAASEAGEGTQIEVELGECVPVAAPLLWPSRTTA